jgi:hypothetical protein
MVAAASPNRSCRSSVCRRARSPERSTWTRSVQTSVCPPDLSADLALELVAGSQQTRSVPEHLHGLLLPRLDRPLDPPVKRRPGLPGQGQRHQVVVRVSHDRRSGAQRGHLRVPGVEQAGAPHQLAHPLNHRQVEGIIGTLTGHHSTRQEVARRLGRRGHQLDLGQVGPMILAVAQLHHPLLRRRVVPVGCRTIQTHPAQFQVIHCHGLGPKLLFQRFPVRGPAQPPQDNAQAIIIELDRPDRLPHQPFQGLLMPLRPLLDGGLTVISFRGDERHPGYRPYAVAQPLTQSVIAQIPVEQLGKSQPLLQTDQQGDIVDSLMAQGQLLGHRPSMPDNSRFCPRVYAKGE